MTVSVHPGQTVSVWQRLWFQMSNVHTDLGALSHPYGGGECSAVSTYKSSTICVHLYRPPATFTGSVGAKVDEKNNGTYVNKKTNGNKITSSDGSFKVQFNGKITRIKRNNKDDDDAGGTVETFYVTNIYENGNRITTLRNPTTSNLGTGEMKVGDDKSIFTSKNVYSGKLTYEDSRTICGILT